jgi:hypothetical protein
MDIIYKIYQDLVDKLDFRLQIGLPSFIKEGIPRLYRSSIPTYARCILDTQVGPTRHNLIKGILKEYQRWIIYIIQKERESRRV